MLGTHQKTPNHWQNYLWKYAVLHKSAGMHPSMTPILCFRASVYLLMWGFMVALSKSMPNAIQWWTKSLFLYESPGSTAQLYMPSAGIAKGQCPLCSSTYAAPFFSEHSIQHLRMHVMFHMEPLSPALSEDLQNWRREFKPKTNNGLYFLQTPLYTISNLWRTIAQRNYKDSYNCPVN